MTTKIVLDGQELTGFDDYGVRWTTIDLAGWGSPASTLSPIQKTRAPGAWRGPSQLTPRHLAPNGIVEAQGVDALRDALDRLAGACKLDGALLEVTEGSLTRSLECFRSDEVLTQWMTDTLASWSLGMIALDPRKYGSPIVTSTGLPSSAGGVTWPLTWPVTWTGVVQTGVLHINNAGNTPAPLTLRIDGPVTSPSIRHIAPDGSEDVLSLGYDLGAGSFLVIDMERRVVLEGGVASRNQWITNRGWFQIEPGGNDLVFTATAGGAAALLTATTAPAYL